MWKKLIGGVLLAGLMCCGSVFAAPASNTTYNSSTELAANNGTNSNGHSSSCGCSSCNFCDIGCSSCEESYFSANIDWLFWKMRRGGLDFAITDGGSYDDLSGHCCDVDPDRDHGVRIGLGYKTCDCWDLGVTYTYWQAEDSATCVDSSDDLYFTRMHPMGSLVTDISGEYAHSNYEIEMHMLDFVAGYAVEAACCTTVRPWCGLRFTFMDQDLTTTYADDHPYDATDNVARIWESVDMDAYGFVAGCDVEYAFWDCFSVFGRVAGMVAYADFDISHVEKDIYVTPTDNISYKCGTDRMISMLELSVGFEWIFYDCDCGKFMLAMGWEMQSWHNMADFVNFDDSSAYGSTSRNNQSFGVEGLFVRLAGEF